FTRSPVHRVIVSWVVNRLFVESPLRLGFWAEALGQPGEQRLAHLAYHSVGWIEDIAQVVGDALPEQNACAGRIKPIILLEPAQHLARRVLHCLVERAGIADGKDVVGVFAARPADALA